MNNSMKFLVKPKDQGMRLDIFLSGKIDNLTRSYIKKIIDSSNTILWNGPAGYFENRIFCRVLFNVKKERY